MKPKNLIFAVVLGVALAAGIYVAKNLRQPAEFLSAFVLPMPSPLPEFALLDQSGNAVSTESFRGQWDIVFFGFTHCPDVCPTTMQTLAAVKQSLVDSGADSLPRIVLISVDPERDTPEIIGRYVNYFGSGNLGVTGDLAEVQKLTRSLGIYFEKSGFDGDDYTVDHSAAVLLVNPDAEFTVLFSAPHTVSAFVHDLPIIMDAN